MRGRHFSATHPYQPLTGVVWVITCNCQNWLMGVDNAVFGPSR